MVTEELDSAPDVIREHVELQNDEGLTVEYWDFPNLLGGHGRAASKAEITKAADSDFERDIRKVQMKIIRILESLWLPKSMILQQ